MRGPFFADLPPPQRKEEDKMNSGIPTWTPPHAATAMRLRRWWLQYRLQCNEGDLAGIEREVRELDGQRREALRRNLLLRLALREGRSR